MLRSLFLLVLIGSAVARTFYRKDYHYFPELEAFYKFHWGAPASSWLEAFTTCASEGATLFYLSVPEEINVVNNLTAAAPKSSASAIFVGIHDEFGIGEFVTVDGSSTPFPILKNDLEANSLRSCVLLNIETGQYETQDCGPEEVNFTGSEVNLPGTDAPPVDNKKAFICKKTVKPSLCPTIDDGYKYNAATKKCYKVHSQLKTWNGAYRQCYMEGAMLFVPENSDEYDEVVRRYIKNNEESNKYRLWRSANSYFIGIYQPQEHGEYFTAKGVPMVSGGVFQRFDPSDDRQIQRGQPNGRADCVIMDRVERYNSEGSYWYMFDDCNFPRQFICEMKSTVFT